MRGKKSSTEVRTACWATRSATSPWSVATIRIFLIHGTPRVGGRRSLYFNHVWLCHILSNVRKECQTACTVLLLLTLVQPTFINVTARFPVCSGVGELWRATGQTYIILQIKMRKRRYIGHTVRKEDECIEKQAIGIRGGPEGQEDRSKPRRRMFWCSRKKRQNMK